MTLLSMDWNPASVTHRLYDPGQANIDITQLGQLTCCENYRVFNTHTHILKLVYMCTFTYIYMLSLHL